jgi:hypothetical protein
MKLDGVTGNPISLIFPRSSSTEELRAILNDVQQFFSKWPELPEIFVPFLPPKFKFANNKGLQLLNNAGLGYGAAIKEGIKRSKNDFSFVLDLPLEFPLADVFQAWMEFESRPGVDIVVGSRRLPESAHLRPPSRWYWKVDSWTHSRLHKHVGHPVKDISTSFYGFRNDRVRPLADEIRDTGFAFTARLVRRAQLEGLGISEKAAHWNPAPSGWARNTRDQWHLLKMALV